MSRHDPDFEVFLQRKPMGLGMKCILILCTALVLLGIGIRIHDAVTGTPRGPGFLKR
jgi:hypothetical protein